VQQRSQEWELSNRAASPSIRTTVSTSSGVRIRRGGALIRARVLLVTGPFSAIRPGLGFAAAAVSFAVPAPAAPLILAALLTAVGSLPSSARVSRVLGVAAGRGICRV
jgi:hypothetical protein